MPHRVFVQARLDVADLRRQAERHFGARIEPAAGAPGRLRLRFVTDTEATSGAFRISERRAERSDFEQATAAEAAGGASGMAALAARCPYVAVVTPEPNTPEAATLLLCGLLAASGLGPVLPDDASTLFGVRGARERAARLLDAARR